MDLPTLAQLLLVIGGMIAANILLAPVLSGWNSLCSAFPVYQEYTGDWLNGQSYRRGPFIHLNMCVSMAFDRNALYLKLKGFPLSRQAEIPWSSVVSITQQRMSFYDNIQFELANGRTITFYYGQSLRMHLHQRLSTLGLTRLIGQKPS